MVAAPMKPTVARGTWALTIKSACAERAVHQRRNADQHSSEHVRLSGLPQHVKLIFGFSDYRKTGSLIEGSRRVGLEDAQSNCDVGPIGLRDDFSQNVGTESLALQLRNKLDLNELPLCAVARDLQKADGRSILQQDFGAIEPIHEAGKVIIFSCTRARGGKVGVHCAPPEFHEERNVLVGSWATRKLNRH